MRDVAKHFDEHGWVLVPNVVPAGEIAAAQAQLLRVYPTPEELTSGVRNARTAPFLDQRPTARG